MNRALRVCVYFCVFCTCIHLYAGGRIEPEIEDIFFGSPKKIIEDEVSEYEEVPTHTVILFTDSGREKHTDWQSFGKKQAGTVRYNTYGQITYAMNIQNYTEQTARLGPDNKVEERIYHRTKYMERYIYNKDGFPERIIGNYPNDRCVHYTDYIYDEQNRLIQERRYDKGKPYSYKSYYYDGKFRGFTAPLFLPKNPALLNDGIEETEFDYLDYYVGEREINVYDGERLVWRTMRYRTGIEREFPKNYHEMIFEIVTAVITYSSHGFPERVVVADGMNAHRGVEITVFDYTYPVIDDKGNWLERIGYRTDSRGGKIEIRHAKRIIEY